MDADTATLAAAIGTRVRDQRLAKRWTLDHLAETSGVSRRMLVSVEQGTVNPSVGTLLRLSEALRVGLPTLVEPPAPTPVRVTRAGTGPALWTGPAGGQGILVAASDRPDIAELWDWTLAGSDVHDSEAHSPGTHELIQVRTGRLTLTAGGHTATLRPGDAVSYPGDVAHTYANHTTSPTRFSLAVFEPGVPTRTEIRHD